MIDDFGSVYSVYSEARRRHSHRRTNFIYYHAVLSAADDQIHEFTHSHRRPSRILSTPDCVCLNGLHLLLLRPAGISQMINYHADSIRFSHSEKRKYGEFYRVHRTCIAFHIRVEQTDMYAIRSGSTITRLEHTVQKSVNI